MTDRPDRSSDGFKTNPQLEENKRLLFEIMAEKEARAAAMPTEADAMSTTHSEIVHPLFDFEGEPEPPASPKLLAIGRIPRPVFVRLNKAWHSRLPIVTNCWRGECYGAEYRNRYYAVAWWDMPVAQALCDWRTMELRRMAVCDQAPKFTASRFLGAMVRDIRKTQPHIRKLISYQDTEVHTGTIYKACGWQVGALSKSHTWHGPKRNRQRADQQSTADKIRWELDL